MFLYSVSYTEINFQLKIDTKCVLLKTCENKLEKLWKKNLKNMWQPCNKIFFLISKSVEYIVSKFKWDLICLAVEIIYFIINLLKNLNFVSH